MKHNILFQTHFANIFRKTKQCCVLSNAGVECTSFEYEYTTFKIIEYEYLVLESRASSSSQSSDTTTRVLFSIFKNNNLRLIFYECLEQFFGCY